MTILEACYVTFLLPPWFRNVSKRLIRSPKLYFYDVGLAEFLLGIENEMKASRDPLRDPHPSRGGRRSAVGRGGGDPHAPSMAPGTSPTLRAMA